MKDPITQWSEEHPVRTAEEFSDALDCEDGTDDEDGFRRPRCTACHEALAARRWTLWAPDGGSGFFFNLRCPRCKEGYTVVVEAFWIVDSDGRLAPGVFNQPQR